MSPIKKGFFWIFVAALMLPVAFILTVITFPFWRWIEATFQIESFGHSGPAEWCYYTVYATTLVVVIAVARVRGNRRSVQE